MSEFKKFRPRDINIESAVGTEKEIPFYVFEEKALNTFDAKLAEERIDLGWRLLRKENIQVTPLREILKKSMPEETIIDLLSVDVEGLDLEVLESNDWARFRPKCIAIEILNTSLHSLENNPIHVFLKEKGYTLRAKTENTGIYTNY